MIKAFQASGISCEESTSWVSSPHASVLFGVGFRFFVWRVLIEVVCLHTGRIMWAITVEFRMLLIRQSTRRCTLIL